MRSKVRHPAGFTSDRANVWNGGSRNIMQIELHPPRTTDLGHCSVFRTLQPEARRAGLNGNSNNREADDFVGWKNKATPSEGAKRRYEAHFVSKLTDCDGESNETDTSLDFARDCGYITVAEYDELAAHNRSVGRMLGR